MFNPKLLAIHLLCAGVLFSASSSRADEVDSNQGTAETLELVEVPGSHVSRVSLPTRNSPGDFDQGRFLHDLAEGTLSKDLLTLDLRLQPTSFEVAAIDALKPMPNVEPSKMLTVFDQNPEIYLEFESGQKLVASFQVPDQKAKQQLAKTESATATLGKFVNRMVEFFRPEEPIPSPIPEAASSFLVCSLVGIFSALVRKRRTPRHSRPAAQ